MTRQIRSNGQPLPVVVRLGFAGSRFLIDSTVQTTLDENHVQQVVETYLRERLKKLHLELGLSERHFFCGISQVAIGGDAIFASVCGSLQIPVRVFLPQHRDAYLDAVGASGTPDFSPVQKAAALGLLNSPVVIQEQIVSDGPDRTTRFADVNREIARASDVVVCLLRKFVGTTRGHSRSYPAVTSTRMPRAGDQRGRQG